MVTHPQLPEAAASGPRRGFKRLLVPATLLATMSGVAGYGWHWWEVGRFLESTENAYLQADKVKVAPRVAGYVTEVLVGDNQPVKAGDIVARLDDRESRIAVQQAEAEIAKSQAELAARTAAVSQQQAQVEAAQADAANAEAMLTFSRLEHTRYGNLLQTGSGTAQRQQQAEADLAQRKAAADKAAAGLLAAREQVRALIAQADAARADLLAAQVRREQAQLNLGYTAVIAPVDGVVGDRSLRIGQFVSPGTGLLSVVPMGRDIYLVANFKETQTRGMVTGQRVTFTVDALGPHEFVGRLDSVSPGTGSQFALLPPENATGNFTKIVQRVPVRVILDGADPMIARLRPGLSVTATVHLRKDLAKADLDIKPMQLSQSTLP